MERPVPGAENPRLDQRRPAPAASVTSDHERLRSGGCSNEEETRASGEGEPREVPGGAAYGRLVRRKANESYAQWPHRCCTCRVEPGGITNEARESRERGDIRTACASESQRELCTVAVQMQRLKCGNCDIRIARRENRKATKGKSRTNKHKDTDEPPAGKKGSPRNQTAESDLRSMESRLKSAPRQPSSVHSNKSASSAG